MPILNFYTNLIKVQEHLLMETIGELVSGRMLEYAVYN